MAWGETKVEDRRKEFVEACIQGDLAMAELCRLFEISRNNGYKWLDRYKNGGDEALKDRSRAPLKQALEVGPEIINEILDVRIRYRTWGPKKVLGWLKTNRPNQDWPSTTTIGNIFDRNGLTVPRKYRRRVPGKTSPLSHCQQSNDVWCTDFKGWFLTGDAKKCDPFTLTDGASRYLLRCCKLSSNNVNHVWGVLDSAFREYGLPSFMRHDNGPPFGSCGVARLTSLSVKLIKAGVTPEWIDPGKPEQNGRHERMHLTLKNETAAPPATTLELQEMKFAEFVNYFNFIRPHEAIEQKTPGSIYQVSSRKWNGVLKSPEYDSEYDVRKIRYCGSIKWHGDEIYIGSVLAGEPVGLKETEEGMLRVSYGPIILGIIDQNNEFRIPPGKKRNRGCSQSKETI